MFMWDEKGEKIMDKVRGTAAKTESQLKIRNKEIMSKR